MRIAGDPNQGIPDRLVWRRLAKEHGLFAFDVDPEDAELAVVGCVYLLGFVAGVGGVDSVDCGERAGDVL